MQNSIHIDNIKLLIHLSISFQRTICYLRTRCWVLIYDLILYTVYFVYIVYFFTCHSKTWIPKSLHISKQYQNVRTIIPLSVEWNFIILMILNKNQFTASISENWQNSCDCKFKKYVMKPTGRILKETFNDMPSIYIRLS